MVIGKIASYVTGVATGVGATLLVGALYTAPKTDYKVLAKNGVECIAGPTSFDGGQTYSSIDTVAAKTLMNDHVLFRQIAKSQEKINSQDEKLMQEFYKQ
jgi:hypothetical protein